jgi:hypothetical protein
MKKLLAIVVLGLLFSGNAYSETETATYVNVKTGKFYQSTATVKYFPIPTKHVTVNYVNINIKITIDAKNHCITSFKGSDLNCEWYSTKDRWGRIKYYSKKRKVEPQPVTRSIYVKPLYDIVVGKPDVIPNNIHVSTYINLGAKNIKDRFVSVYSYKRSPWYLTRIARGKCLEVPGGNLETCRLITERWRNKPINHELNKDFKQKVENDWIKSKKIYRKLKTQKIAKQEIDSSNPSTEQATKKLAKKNMENNTGGFQSTWGRSEGFMGLKVENIHNGFTVNLEDNSKLILNFNEMMASKISGQNLDKGIPHRYEIKEYNEKNITLEQTYKNFNEAYDDGTCKKKCKRKIKKVLKNGSKYDVFLKQTYYFNNGNLHKTYHPYSLKPDSKIKSIFASSKNLITKPISVTKNIVTNSKNKLTNIKKPSVKSFVKKYDDEIELVLWAALAYVALDNADSIGKIFKNNSNISASSGAPKSSLKRYILPRGGVKYVPDSKGMRLLMKSKGAVGF